tara:strand:- start:8226 stop:9764 length:1539 start_codon:yes stop_codon:yes gene_type:complete
MKCSLKYFYFVFILVFLSVFDGRIAPALLAQNLIEIKPKIEIKDGKLLIGVKQYLGNNTKYPNNSDVLDFETKNNLINLYDSKGLQYKSKKFKILFKKISIEKPILLERFISGPYSSFETAKKRSNILEKKGFRPMIVNPDDWELWLPKESKNITKENFKLKKIIIRSRSLPYLSDEYNSKQISGPIIIESPENIKINNVPYGKKFYLVKDSYGSWTLIQRITFEKYLRGVLPHEMGSNSPLEALKAQAVIARTWAIYNSDRFKSDNYHLCITTQCQVYKPYNSINKIIDQAISDTANEIITFGNSPINAFYHASNGGISSQSNESWQIEEYPYFLSKFDFRNYSSFNPKYPIKNIKDLKVFIEDDPLKYFGYEHRLFRWEIKMSSQEIKSMLRKKNLIPKDNLISDIKVSKRGTSGRVTALDIYTSTSNKLLTLRKDDIRRNLKFLPSNLFIINKLNNNFWTFKGGGFGHGVGLSQSGAIDMAKSGFTYEKILNHYYVGTKLKNYQKLMDK